MAENKDLEDIIRGELVLAEFNGHCVILDNEDAIVTQLTKVLAAGYKSPAEVEEWQADFTDKMAKKYDKRVAEVEARLQPISDKIAELNKKLDDREADLINATAKSQWRDFGSRL